MAVADRMWVCLGICASPACVRSYTLRHCMVQCLALCCIGVVRGGGDKKERKGLPHRQIWALEAPLVSQSQLLGSDGCLRSAVWCPFIHSLTSLPLSPSFAEHKASRGCGKCSCLCWLCCCFYRWWFCYPFLFSVSACLWEAGRMIMWGTMLWEGLNGRTFYWLERTVFFGSF